MSYATVLVVEDDHSLRGLVGDFLDSVGFHVIQARTADDAISLIDSGAEIHAVFSDINMPGKMDGLDLARWLRFFHPRTKIVLTSGCQQRDTAELCDGGPMISKPFSLTVVATRLLSVCGIEGRS